MPGTQEVLENKAVGVPVFACSETGVTENICWGQGEAA